ncbi:hypothetical protein BGLA2_880011 [Burkholderia gladioli]|nr:hypothetical protein BGLA2_880011 [Burkholderia gladioli]
MIGCQSHLASGFSESQAPASSTARRIFPVFLSTPPDTIMSGRRALGSTRTSGAQTKPKSTLLSMLSVDSLTASAGAATGSKCTRYNSSFAGLPSAITRTRRDPPAGNANLLGETVTPPAPERGASSSTSCSVAGLTTRLTTTLTYCVESDFEYTRNCEALFDFVSIELVIGDTSMFALTGESNAENTKSTPPATTGAQ